MSSVNIRLDIAPGALYLGSIVQVNLLCAGLYLVLEG